MTLSFLPRRLRSLSGAFAPMVAAGLGMFVLVGVAEVLSDGDVGLGKAGPPRGVFHGWVAAGTDATGSVAPGRVSPGRVSPGGARVLLPADVCGVDDELMSLTLSGGPGAGAGREMVLEPPLVRATGAAIDRGQEVMVLDMSSAYMAAEGRSRHVYTRATARCRSWSERTWELGVLSATAVERELGDADALRVFVVSEPQHTGVLALLMVQSRAVPVDLVALGLGHGSATAGSVLAAAGSMEHWQAWEQEALGWRADGRPLGPVDSNADDKARVVTAGPTDPTPPLTWRPSNDLGLHLEPYSTAVIVVGEWTYAPQRAGTGGATGTIQRLIRQVAKPRPNVVLSYPVVTYRTAGTTVTVGLAEPIYAELR